MCRNLNLTIWHIRRPAAESGVQWQRGCWNRQLRTFYTQLYRTVWRSKSRHVSISDRPVFRTSVKTWLFTRSSSQTLYLYVKFWHFGHVSFSCWRWWTFGETSFVSQRVSHGSTRNVLIARQRHAQNISCPPNVHTAPPSWGLTTNS